jgi:hypothetical protein
MRGSVNSGSEVPHLREVKDMNPFAHHKASLNSNSRCADVTTMAERELSAFFNATTQLFGSEQAELSAEDWLQELETVASLPASPREWRWITAKATARLASRVNASSLLTEFANA